MARCLCRKRIDGCRTSSRRPGLRSRSFRCARLQFSINGALVVTLECLDAFDHLIWLRTGERAAAVMGCNQSTISRHSSRCQQIFQLKLKRVASEWQLSGETDLLSAQRKLHQRYRWERGLPLRLEAQHWMRDIYASWQLPDWTKGNLNYLEYERPLQLLKDRIIDAWLCGAPDVPDDPGLSCVQLFDVPMLLAAPSGHPLLRRQGPLSLTDVAAYPLLPLPQMAFPVFQARLAELGLVGDAAAARSAASQAEAEGVSFEQRCLGIASALTLPLYGPDYQALPVEIPIHFGDVLVVRTEFAGHRRHLQLRDSLLAHLRSVTAACRAVRVLEPRDGSPARTPALPHDDGSARYHR